LTKVYISDKIKTKTMQKMDRTEKEIRDLRDEGIENLLHLSYDDLANGSRYPRRNRKADPAQIDALKRLFGIPGASGLDTLDPAKPAGRGESHQPQKAISRPARRD
jgi:hypothetical protein